MAVRSLNRVTLIGNLTRDPELKYTSSGAAVCTFGVATNRSWRDPNGEEQEAAEFHNIVAWGKLAEICQQLLAVGMKVYLDGSLRTRNWDDDKGITHYRTEIRLDELILLNDKGKEGVGMPDDAQGSSNSSSISSSSKSSKSPEELLEELDEDEKTDSKGSSAEVDDNDDKKEDPLDDDLPF